MTVKRGKWKARRVVMGRSLRPVELDSVKTSRDVLRAAELGIDLEYDSDKNLLHGYISLIRHGQIMQIPPAIRGKLARAELITYQCARAHETRQTNASRDRGGEEEGGAARAH